MRSKNKRKVSMNTKTPTKTVTNPLLSQISRDKVWFDFQSRNWLKSVRTKGFTNFFFDSVDHSKCLFYILDTLVPNVIKNWDSIVSRSGRFHHCHLIKDEKKIIAREIYKKIHEHELSEDVNIWQLGLTGGERLVCIFNDAERALVPIFLDNHHLIYPNEKHNQVDYESSSFCAVCTYT